MRCPSTLYFERSRKRMLGALPDFSLGDVSWLKVALPLAISFVTFTLTAYVVDVYRGRYPAERRLTIVLGYVLFALKSAAPSLPTTEIYRASWPFVWLIVLGMVPRLVAGRYPVGAASLARGVTHFGDGFGGSRIGRTLAAPMKFGLLGLRHGVRPTRAVRI